MKRVLITGATGFIGGHLSRRLVADGFAVRACVRSRTARSKLEDAVEVTPIEDIGPETEWSAALAGVDYVVHLAARAHRTASEERADEAAFFRVNVEGTRRLASAVAQTESVRRLVFVSSIGAVCSSSERPLSESAIPSPDTAYGRSKLAAEKAMAEELASASADWCVVRPPLVYGPGNPGNMDRLLGLVASGLPLPLGAIHNRRSLIYVGNLVDVLARCPEHASASNRIFHVSDRETVSTAELVRRLAAASGDRVRLFPLPAGLLRSLGGIGDAVERLLGRSVGVNRYSVERLLESLEVDATAVGRALDWTPPFTLEEGLRATLGSRAAA